MLIVDVCKDVGVVCFLVWMFGMDGVVIDVLVGVGFDVMFLLLCWWDFCVGWMVEEYVCLVVVVLFIVIVEVLFGMCYGQVFGDVMVCECVYCCFLYVVDMFDVGWLMLLGFECGVLLLMLVECGDLFDQ